MGDMMAQLPAEIRREIEAELDDEKRSRLVAEVRELIVASLATGGVSA